MQAALAAGPALGADETPVSVLTPDEDPGAGQPDDGFPHVLVIRPPDGDLTWLRALGSRRAAASTAIPGLVTGSSLPAETASRLLTAPLSGREVMISGNVLCPRFPGPRLRSRGRPEPQPAKLPDRGHDGHGDNDPGKIMAIYSSSANVPSISKQSTRRPSRTKPARSYKAMAR